MHFQLAGASVALLFSALAAATPVALQKRQVGPLPTNTDFQNACLNNHNWYRSIHHSPNLVWDSTLASAAQTAANKCKLQQSGAGYGENSLGANDICTDWNKCTADAIKLYMSEENSYNYHDTFPDGLPSNFASVGHFTQVVWKGSSRLGCSWNTVTCPNSGRYFYCEYSPNGNLRGTFPSNVLQP